ncbi:hypothetical protein Cpin_6545 [Chitinophaga pinensis DSM 2588]|uniref:Uncharacterized protein n=1 Tax=Chitinophaga pinensis (strain ATCC 43595 / DSM 2588 / LMG 13176 / NBRC 15968 / NCIMB 11800 / UQM 2034) TaxID=485918 RepID=A0A979GZF5_CHIPD|nr:hypothetical protein Cpin_6545 [Chitinophaga pinensis DSM 2588]
MVTLAHQGIIMALILVIQRVAMEEYGNDMSLCKEEIRPYYRDGKCLPG